MLSEQIRNIERVERIGTHSHIRGLGLGDSLEPIENSNGIVGQYRARKALGVISRLVQQRRLAGRAVLLTGQMGSGKTALAIALAASLAADAEANNIPFTSITASELFSLEMSKSEALTQAMRKSVGVCISEDSEVIEGEVVELKVEKPVTGGARTGRITMRTTDMETVYELGQKLIEGLQKERVQGGDIVQIDKATGRVSKLGRSHAKQSEFDFSANVRIVPCPEGELQQRRQITNTVSLHDIDVINSRAHGFLALFSGEVGEIKPEVREQIDTKVGEWQEEGKASIVPGVLFIDEAHLMDLECFAFLNRALELETAPVVVLATNRGADVAIRGTDERGPHGMPLDFLDRTLIVATEAPTLDDISLILEIRCNEEDVRIDADALAFLAEIGTQTSLRYAIHLIPAASLEASRKGVGAIRKADINRVYSLLLDSKRSSGREVVMSD